MAVGKPMPMLDAVARVTGDVAYATNLRLSDSLKATGMLVAKVLRSPYPYTRILRVDTRAAEELPGVAAVLTSADLSDEAGGPNLFYGVIRKDQPIVARDRVRYVGEPVVAESIEIAQEALMLIDVEYEELPAVYDAIDALQPAAPTLHDDVPDNCFVHAKLRHSNAEAGFADADEIIEETFTSPVAQHVSLEPHVSAAQWQDGQLTIWTAAQAPYREKEVLAELFNLDADAVHVIVPQVGGGYGDKGHVRLEPLVAALAWKVGGRPVKLTRAEEFVTVTKHAANITTKTGVKRDGTITARQVMAYWNGGAYADISPGLVRSGMVRSVGPYRIPHVRVDSYGIYTNLPPAAAFRGAMSSQTT